MPFLDIYMPPEIPGYPCISAPRTNTKIQVSAGGGERRNQEWQDPLHKFILPNGVRTWEVVDALGKMWKVTRGPFYSFAWRDPIDKASCDLLAPNEPDADVEARISRTDQSIGTGDGINEIFQLTKLYSYQGQTYTRTIYLPVLSTLVVANNGVLVDPSNYTVTRPGGSIQFHTAPANGRAITAGFLFDVEVRFESDDAFEGIVQTWQAGGFSDVTLVEVRRC